MMDPLVRLMVVPAVTQALADAEAAIDAMALTARRRSEKYRADAWSAAAIASAALDDSDPRLAAAVLMEVQEMRNLRTSLLQALARLHSAASVDRPQGERGRPRADFTEGDRLADLANLVAHSTSPAFLVASIAHGEVLALAPFTASNGLIARAIWRGIMIESGLEPTGMLMYEVGLRDLGRDAYEHALARYQTGTADGVADWMKHCSCATELGADALRQMLE